AAVQAFEHFVVLPGNEQALAVVPSHLPPHTVPLPTQDLPAPSGAPAGFVMQVPRDPATLHDWQTPLHALLQQTPSTHWPDMHCDALVHTCPLLRRPQDIEVQLLVPEHWAFVEQLEKQPADPLQT